MNPLKRIKTADTINNFDVFGPYWGVPFEAFLGRLAALMGNCVAPFSRHRALLDVWRVSCGRRGALLGRLRQSEALERHLGYLKWPSSVRSGLSWGRPGADLGPSGGPRGLWAC